VANANGPVQTKHFSRNLLRKRTSVFGSVFLPSCRSSRCSRSFTTKNLLRCRHRYSPFSHRGWRFGVRNASVRRELTEPAKSTLAKFCNQTCTHCTFDAGPTKRGKHVRRGGRAGAGNWPPKTPSLRQTIRSDRRCPEMNRLSRNGRDVSGRRVASDRPV